jgi:nucleotide-binding universal stress UspA family protein
MISISRILCPVDFSAASQHALAHAAALAAWYDAALTVQYVYAVGVPAAALAPGLGPIGAAAVLGVVDETQLLRDLQHFAATTPPMRSGTAFTVTPGPTARAIVEEARTAAADLIVLGTHGRSGFDRLMLGSTTEKVLRAAPCSVLTVPPAATAAPAPHLFARIVAATDFSAASEQALRYALSLAQEANARLTVLNVVQMPDTSGEWISAGAPDWRAMAEDIVAVARQRVTDAIPARARQWCDIVERVETGRAYQAILRVAAEDRAGLIVMGVHGHGVVDRLFFGSTTQHVVRQATCPVLTVRRAAD